MSTNIDTIIAELTKFGASIEEARVYLEILQGRGDTALTISRNTKFKRTKVYRLLDNLIAKGLVFTGAGERGLKFIAASPTHLEHLLSDKEHELSKLKSSLPMLQQELEDLKGSAETPTKVLYYHGLDGLKQVTYNSLKAKGELLTYELATMNAFLSEEEAEKLRIKFVGSKIKIRTLTSAVELKGWTNVSEMVEKYWEIRHLAPLDTPFHFEILIYNDVYCMYRYTGGEVFCVEIHSQELADMQRQLFEYLWVNAHKFKILDNHGTAKLA